MPAHTYPLSGNCHLGPPASESGGQATRLLPTRLERLVVVRRFTNPLRDVASRGAHATFCRIGPLSRCFLADGLAHGVHRHGAVPVFAKPVLNRNRRCSRQVPRSARLRLLHDGTRRFPQPRTPDHDGGSAYQKKLHTPHFQPDWNFVPSETSGVQLKNFSVAASLAACFWMTAA